MQIGMIGLGRMGASMVLRLLRGGHGCAWRARRSRGGRGGTPPRGPRDRSRAGVAARAQYDADQAGNAAPHTDFVSRGDLRGMLSGFSSVEIRKRNIDVAHLPLARPVLLRLHLDRFVGLDLYARAVA